MNIHELRIKLKVDTTEAEEAIARVKAQVAQDELQQFKQRVLDIVQKARVNMEVYHIDLLLRDAPYNPEPALDEIFKLCQEEGNRDNT